MAIRPAILVIFLTATASAQSSPQDLLRSALERQNTAATSKTRFTNLRLTHTVNTEPDGAVIYNATEKFEETWINDLPYLRLLEFNGKPLTGGSQREEQQRYDRAVAGRQPLGADERIRLADSRPVSLGVHAADALAPDFSLRELRQEGSPQGPVHLLEATGNPAKPALCRWRYQFWISGGTLLRYRVDVSDTPPPPDSCRGAFEDVTYQLFDGFSVKSHERIRLYLYEQHDRITVDGETTYSNYRRFSTTVTIGPATSAPE